MGFIDWFSPNNSANVTEVLTRLSHIMVNALTLDELLGELRRLLCATLRLGRVAIALVQPEGTYACRLIDGLAYQDITLDKKSPLVTYFLRVASNTNHEDTIIDYETLVRQHEGKRISEEEKIEINALIGQLSELKFSLAVPLYFQSHLIGLLFLARIKSRDRFSSQELAILDMIAHVAAAAIQNSTSFERLKRLDEIKSELISVASHELRTPLAVSRWNLELLVAGDFGQIPSKALDILGITYDALMTLNTGLNNLMIVLEIEEGTSILHYELCQMRTDIIDHVTKQYRREIARKKITLSLEVADVGDVIVDREKIRVVLQVIFDNAIRYSPDGSTVTLVVRGAKKDEGHSCIITIEDSGIGIKNENRDLVFRRFFRGEEAKRMSPDGFGLGLFIARAYIEMHGGNVWMGKKESAGSIIYIALPLQPGDKLADSHGLGFFQGSKAPDMPKGRVVF